MDNETLHSDLFLRDRNDINVHKSYLDHDHYMHSHDFIEIAYISSGRGTHMIGDDHMRVSPGDIFILNTNVYHRFVSDKDAPLTIYNCIFKSGTIDEALDEKENFIDIAHDYLFHTFNSDKLHTDYIKLTGKETGSIERLIEEMYTEYGLKQEGYFQVVKSDLYKLLIYIYRIYKSDASQNHSNTTYKQIVADNTLSYLSRHYAQDIRCEQLAERAYLSLSYFNKLFKEVTGSSVIKTLQNIRIEEACKLLQNSHLPVTEIAEKVGYSDIKHFYRLFRQIKNTTPGKYKNQFKTSRLNYD